MDAYEATKLVMTRIQSLDPENASRIMGYILIQDQGEEEMIRLAFGPESLLLSHINQAKAYLGLPSNIPSPKPLTPLASPIRPNSSFPQTSPRILIPNNGFHFGNPSSTTFPRNSPRPVSYAAVLNGSTTCSNSDSSHGPGSPSLHFYGGNDFGDEFLNGGGPVQRQVQDQLPFVDDSVVDPIMSPSGRSDSLMFPYGEDLKSIPSPHPHPFHRGNCSVNDAAFLFNLEEVGGGGSGFGWKPCMYFARGFCKNGSSCKFSHSDVGGGEAIEAGSPSSMFDEFLRMKALQQQQQQRFALMSPRGHHPFPYNNRMGFLNDNLRMNFFFFGVHYMPNAEISALLVISYSERGAFVRSADAALMMSNKFHKFNKCGPNRHDYSSMGLAAGASPSSRQIYLTFPADSTFKEEDVSGYFSMFGPVEDVRIPYQQKRMFGFVTFAYPQTVRLILAKGNPHFVCDSRVLVKPYKEKGKIPDRKQLQQQHQHQERGEHSACLSPSGIDSRELFDLPIGSRMFLSTQEMMLRSRLEQENIELQSPPAGVSISSPRPSELLMSQNVIASSYAANQDGLQEFDDGQEASKSPPVAADNEKLLSEETKYSTTTTISNGIRHQNVDDDDSYLPESLEHILPDNLFASPTKLAAERRTIFSHPSTEAVDTTTPVTSSNNTLCYQAVLPSAWLLHPSPKGQGVVADHELAYTSKKSSSCTAKPYQQQKKKISSRFIITIIINTTILYLLQHHIMLLSIGQMK
ncbi:Zinc finger CCCH domain-containing protein 22 [Sesamum angolense]|uniref:Zinc finger CCCH domain-containing protein 22 n=1 Tax=Sesamum angolense TaxID=2727404 RepID=A0AAE2C426_9LAMI|nr:Zinc finger CCCH domain-containing protein 22 [Sesamum angolense]